MQTESPLIRAGRLAKAARGAKPLVSTLRRGVKKKRRPATAAAPAPLFVRIAELSFHPLLDRVGLLPDLIEREDKLGRAQGKSRAAHKAAAEEMQHDFRSLVHSIARHGIREPLKVVRTPAGWQIADGRHRFEAARVVVRNYSGLGHSDEAARETAHCFETIGLPCEEVAAADVVPIIMDAVNRRHLSKGARAYLAVLMFPEAALLEKRGGDRSKTAQNAVLVTPSKTAQNAVLLPTAFSAENLAREAGVSPRLIEDAIGLYHAFAEREDVRKRFEPAIWVGAGLAKLRAGIKGYLATGEEPDEEPETDEQAAKRIAMGRTETALGQFVRVQSALKFWDTLPPDCREIIIENGCQTMLEAPAEFRAALLAKLTAAAPPADAVKADFLAAAQARYGTDA